MQMALGSVNVVRRSEPPLGTDPWALGLPPSVRPFVATMKSAVCCVLVASAYV
jgi:hypothetical protein